MRRVAELGSLGRSMRVIMFIVGLMSLVGAGLLALPLVGFLRAVRRHPHSTDWILTLWRHPQGDRNRYLSGWQMWTVLVGLALLGLCLGLFGVYALLPRRTA